MNRTITITVGVALLLAGCGGGGADQAAPSRSDPPTASTTPTPTLSATPTPTPTSGPINLRIEWWSEFEGLDDGKCRLLDTTGEWRQRISTGGTVALVGPTEEELAASSFGSGRLEKTTETDDTYWANLPTKKICVFEADFADVPIVATYRTKYRDGYIAENSYARDLLDSYDGTMGIFFQAEVRDCLSGPKVCHHRRGGTDQEVVMPCLTCGVPTRGAPLCPEQHAEVKAQRDAQRANHAPTRRPPSSAATTQHGDACVRSSWPTVGSASGAAGTRPLSTTSSRSARTPACASTSTTSCPRAGRATARRTTRS